MTVHGPAHGRTADEEETVEAAQAALAPVEGDPADGSGEGRNGREEAAQRLLEDFPYASFRDAAPHLRRPFTPEAVRFKVQSAWGDASDASKGGCVIVGYIDARLVIERLNLVLADAWEDDYEEGPDGLWCLLTVGGVTRRNVSDSSKKGKARVSDALKRAGVAFGVGVSIYAAPSGRMTAQEHGTGDAPMIKRRVKETRDGKKVVSFDLTPAGHGAARARYATWLEETGVKAFGEPLDHGDVEESQGSDDEGQEEGPAEVVAPTLLVDREADELRGEVRAVYREVGQQKGGRVRLPPARFDEKLRAASVSHDALRELKVELGGLLAKLKGGQS